MMYDINGFWFNITYNFRLKSFMFISENPNIPNIIPRTVVIFR